MSEVATISMLLEHFERIAEAPGAVARFRRFVLELAVRGRLVAQDPSDEPASELLARISRARTPAVDVKPNACEQLPATWECVPLQAVVIFGPQNGVSPRASERPDAPKAITLTATTKGRFDPRHFKRVALNVPADSELWLRPGDLLFQRGNTRDYVGVAAVYDGPPGEFLYPDLMIKVRVSADLDLRYVHLASIAPPARGYFSSVATGAQASMPKINHAALMALPLPIPPIAEQHRIVAKVDELMALCDEQEAAQAKREKRRDRLVAASLHALTNGEGADEPASAQAREQSVRFYLNHFPHLTTRPEHIQQLRRAILDLALRGCLVERGAAEPPFVARSNSKAGVEQPPVRITAGKSSAAAFALPPRWVAATLAQITTSISDGDHLPPPKTDSGVPFLVIGDVRSGRPDFTRCRYVSEGYYASLDPIRRPQLGDLLYTLVGSFGIPVVVSGARRFCIQRHIAIIRPGPLVDVNFLARVLASRFVFNQAAACATGIAQKTVPLSGLRRIVVPVPPLAEQHRIVAKIDQLAALCDALEGSLDARRTRRGRLLEAALHGALAGWSSPSTHRAPSSRSAG